MHSLIVVGSVFGIRIRRVKRYVADGRRVAGRPGPAFGSRVACFEIEPIAFGQDDVITADRYWVGVRLFMLDTRAAGSAYRTAARTEI